MDVMGRITDALVPLRVLEKFANSPEQKRTQAMNAVMVQLKEKGYSEDEIRTMIRHLPTLRKMLDAVEPNPGDR
jgi:hypothetical protein